MTADSGRSGRGSPQWASRVTPDRASTEDIVTWFALVGALGTLVLIRTWIPYDGVFYDRSVVLAGNDPFRYRYFVETLLADSASPFRPRALAGLPEGIRTNDVLFIASAWAAAELLGGSPHDAGVVLAWYPVIFGVLSASLAYLVTVRLTADHRLGVLVVFILAVTPAHAYRTMLGFGDHDAFHYLWLVITATALVYLATSEPWDRPWRELSHWLAVGALAVGVAALCFAWRGGPILLVPIAGFACAVAISCVYHGRSPVVATWGLLVGLTLAASVSSVLHVGLSWAEPHRGFAPALLLVLVGGIVAVSELSYRHELPWPAVPGEVAIVTGGWFVGVWRGTDAFAGPMRRFVAYFRRYPLEPEYQIGETASLIGDPRTPVVLFGLLLVVALPTMVRIAADFRSSHRPGWIVVSAYTWTLLGLSVVQLRFAGLLAVFIAIFAGLGVRYMTSWMDGSLSTSTGSYRESFNAAETGLTDAARSVGVVLLIVVLLTGLGLAQLPGTMDQTTVEETTHETAAWIDDHADDHGYTYPENYVFTAWGHNLAYNHIVSGQSRSYGYAQGNYRAFVSSTDGDEWYGKLEGRAGYVVVQDTTFTYPEDSLQVRLNDRFGSAGDDVSGLAHYRLVYISDDGTTKVFTLVPGATIAGNATPNTTVRINSTVEVGDTAFAYRRSIETGPDGEYAVTVPYPGRYSVGTETVTVSESNVTSGDALPTGPE